LLQCNGQTLVDEDQKAEALYEFFNDILGKPVQREKLINLDLLDLPQINLSELSACFTKEEVLTVIHSLLPNKALSPDGFTTCFLQMSWETIRADLMMTFDAFWHLDTRKFHTINEAIMVLLPKTQNAKAIKEYRPISLIHVIGKLFSKVLANRLAPQLAELIHATHSAFVKGQYIQDNFCYVQASTRLLHARRLPALLLEVDISRAFDSVCWLFLLDVMSFVRFLAAWREWIVVLLSSASTRIQLNSVQGDKICHARDLQQGDPLSPMLFLLVMEVLNCLFRKVDHWKLL
jgi:hypothetical protein